MAFTTGQKWGVAIVAILAIIIIVYFLYKSLPSASEEGQTSTTTTTTPGLLSFAGGFINQIKDFFGKDEPYVTVACDPSRPGYNVDGLYDNNCQ